MRSSLRGLLATFRSGRREAELYADVRRYSAMQWEAEARRIRQLCARRSYTPEWTEVWVSHRYRLRLSVDWLRELLLQHSESVKALELGGASLVSDLLNEEFPAWEWRNTMSDLRQPLEFADSSVDLVVAMEVLEHLADLPGGYNDSFASSGVKALLDECCRVLKPGGILFITTPNAASVVHLHKLLLGSAPWFYPKHVREYTAGELVELVQGAGFEVMRCKDVHCLTVGEPFDHRPVLQLLEASGYSLGGRGDDLFLTARSMRTLEH